MSDTPNWLTIARLLRPQGRKGELLADLLTDFPERFATHPRVTLLAPTAPPKEFEVESHWLPTGRNAGRIVLKFAGIDSINDAETIAGREVVVPQTERLALAEDEGETYISDLLGCIVLDAGREIGIIEDVHFPTTPDGARHIADAAPLLVVKSPTGDEILIPFVRAFLKNFDVPNKRIEMNLPDGLVEING